MPRHGLAGFRFVSRRWGGYVLGPPRRLGGGAAMEYKGFKWGLGFSAECPESALSVSLLTELAAESGADLYTCRSDGAGRVRMIP